MSEGDGWGLLIEAELTGVGPLEAGLLDAGPLDAALLGAALLGPDMFDGAAWPVQPASSTQDSAAAGKDARTIQAFFQMRIQSTVIDGRFFCFLIEEFFTPDPDRARGLVTRAVSQSELSRLSIRS